MVRLYRPLRGLLPICSALALAACSGDIIESATEFGDEVEDSGGDTGQGGETSGSGSTSEGTSSGTSESTSGTSDASTSDSSTSDSSTSDSTGTTGTTESTSESTSDSTTGTTSTSDSTTDTGDNGCAGVMSFLVPATAYASASGFVETMSMIGEGMVMAVPDGVNAGTLVYELDIPCDDTWHIWIRAIDYQDYDSLWVEVDGQPANWAIFDVDCTIDPAQTTYVWNELNWRDPAEQFACQYVEDPWTHDWSAGIHTLSLGYRESWAISKIWFTNGNGTPP